MSIDSTDLNSFPHPTVAVRFLGSGTAKPSCGLLVTTGHHTATGKVHVKAFRRRCQRADCPECSTKERGYVDQAVRRIEDGITKGTTPGADRDVTEFVVTPQLENPADLRDAEVRGRIVKEIRKGLQRICIEPGAWVAHYAGSEIQDYGPDARIRVCPADPHLHIFIRRDPGIQVQAGRPATDMQGRELEYRRLSDTLQISETSKPELWHRVRGVALYPISGLDSRGRKRRGFVPVIGWFGRRKGKGLDAIDRELKEKGELERPERLCFCPICKTSIRKVEWLRVITSQFVPKDEGAWELEEAEVRWIYEPEWRLDG
jgi:hypothetical protein